MRHLIISSIFLALYILLANCSSKFYEENPFFYPYHPKKSTESLISNYSSIYFNGDYENITNCTYFKLDKILSCENIHRIINCSTVLNLTGLQDLSFEIYGFSVFHNFSDISPSYNKYKLYPFQLFKETNTSLVYNYSIPLNTQSLDITLAQSNTTFVKGLKVLDFVCFNELIGMLNESNYLNRLKELSDIVYDRLIANIFIN